MSGPLPLGGYVGQVGNTELLTTFVVSVAPHFQGLLNAIASQIWKSIIAMRHYSIIRNIDFRHEMTHRELEVAHKLVQLQMNETAIGVH